MNNLYNNVFYRSAESELIDIDINDVYSTIPKDNLKIPDRELKKTHIEWRWRFLRFGENLVVEISRYLPKNNKRFYLNNKKEWVTRNISSSYDKYVVEKYYYYAKE